MPSPVAHTFAGACVAALAARRLPAAGALPVAAALIFAANLPDLDYLALVRGRAAMEDFHQGAFHSVGFVAAATLPLALLLRRRLGISRAWLLLAAAGLTHLLLDLLVVDLKPPVGFPFFWPLSAERFHASFTLFPGIDRVTVFSRRNLNELLAELAWFLPSWPLLFRWLPWRTPAKDAP
ncbi:MAG: metal-dependent hydrolase [Candidatus Methylomirabilia bacterium]